MSKALKAVRLDWKDGKMHEVAGSESELPCDNAFLAMGFTNPVGSLLDSFGIEKDARQNAQATTDGEGCYATNVAKVFAVVTSVVVSHWLCGQFEGSSG